MRVFEGHIEAYRNDDGSVTAELTADPADRDSYEIRQRIANKENEELAAFERGETDSAEGPVVWAASGAIPVLQVEEGPFVPLGLRDAGAPTYPHHFASASGMSHNVDEMFDPRRICIREGVEEVLYGAVNDDGEVSRWLVPDPVNPYDPVDAYEAVDPLYQKWEDTADSANGLLSGDEPALASSELERESVPASLHEIGDDELTIRIGNEERTIAGHLVIDSEKGAVDVIDVLAIDATDWSIEDLRIFDGETVDDRLANRDVFLFDTGAYAMLTEDSPDRATAHRRYKSGRVWSGYHWVTEYGHGAEVPLTRPQVVPNARGTGAAIREVLDDL